MKTFCILIIHFVIMSLVLFSDRDRSELLSEAVRDIPDYCQTDPEGKLPGQGRTYCAAVASAEYLYWLANNGYPLLADLSLKEKDSVFKLAEELGSPKRMNAANRAVTPEILLRELVRYVKERGYSVDKANYMGWDPLHYNSEFQPDTEALRDLMKGKSIVLLLVGKYRKQKGSDLLVSRGFHIISLVGWNSKSGRLAIQCSSPRSSRQKKTEFINITKHKSIRFRVKPLNLDIKGRNYPEITDGILWKRPEDIILVNGFVQLSLK